MRAGHGQSHFKYKRFSWIELVFPRFEIGEIGSNKRGCMCIIIISSTACKVVASHHRWHCIHLSSISVELEPIVYNFKVCKQQKNTLKNDD